MTTAPAGFAPTAPDQIRVGDAVITEPLGQRPGVRDVVAHIAADGAAYGALHGFVLFYTSDSAPVLAKPAAQARTESTGTMLIGAGRLRHALVLERGKLIRKKELERPYRASHVSQLPDSLICWFPDADRKILRLRGPRRLFWRYDLEALFGQ